MPPLIQLILGGPMIKGLEGGTGTKRRAISVNEMVDIRLNAQGVACAISKHSSAQALLICTQQKVKIGNGKLVVEIQQAPSAGYVLAFYLG